MTEAKTNVTGPLVVGHARTLDELEAEKRGAQQQVTAINKKIKAARKLAEKDGLHMKAFDMCRSLLKDDEDEIFSLFRALGDHLRAFRHPAGSQLDLFEQPNRAPQDEVARVAGYMCGVRGGNIEDNPHMTGDRGYQPWIDGYHEGQKVLATGLAEIKAPRDQTEDDAEPAQGTMADGEETDDQDVDDGFEDDADLDDLAVDDDDDILPDDDEDDEEEDWRADRDAEIEAEVIQ